MEKRLIAFYKNGNYLVHIFEDGTKIRSNEFNKLIPKFPESIDCKISNRCDKGCPMCHEQSTPDGDLADLSHPLFDSIHPHTELALGGGDVLEHPDLEDFLWRMKEQAVICNMTLHIDHLLSSMNFIKYLQDQNLVYGVGVSINKRINPITIDRLNGLKNVIVHTIAGVMPMEGYESLFDANIKLLILGYKAYGRGLDYQNANNVAEKIDELKYNLKFLMPHFKLISFDNLALKQLNVKDIVPQEEWDKCFMGDDGKYTMYLDMVEKKYSKSSTSTRRDIFSNRIEDLFNDARRGVWE